MDSSQDYRLLLGYENKTHTVLRFSRRYDTCDPRDLKITVGDAIYAARKTQDNFLPSAAAAVLAHCTLPRTASLGRGIYSARLSRAILRREINTFLSFSFSLFPRGEYPPGRD